MLFLILQQFVTNSQTYRWQYTPTTSFAQYTSLISAMLGVKPATVYVKEERVQTNWAGGRVFAPIINCPPNQTICLTSGSKNKTEMIWKEAANLRQGGLIP